MSAITLDQMTRAPRQMIAAAAACAAAFCVLLWLAYAVGPAERLDGNALDGFVAASNATGVWRLAEGVAFTCNPGPYALLVLPLLTWALVKRGARHAGAAALLLVGANVSSQVLKVLLAHPRGMSAWPAVEPIDAAAFPSGHATASMALAFAAVLVAPRAYRPLVAAVGGLFALAVSLSVVVLAWHFPSDVVGGQLLAATWCLIALAALRFSAERWPEQGSMRRAAREALVMPPARAIRVALLAALVVALAAVAGPFASFARDYTSAVAVAAAIAASGVALLAGVTALAARR
jgi:membrane-associated phospholipid phosphatase